MRGKESWENERGERERKGSGERKIEREWGSGRKRKIKWVERVSERERERERTGRSKKRMGQLEKKLEEKKCGKEKVGKRERGEGEREEIVCVGGRENCNKE